MYNTLGITFGVGIWTSIILFASLIVSKSWIILFFIVLNIAVFVFFGLSEIKRFEVVKNLGSQVIKGICYARSLGFNII